MKQTVTHEPPANFFTENRSGLFDWTVFALSISLGFVFPNLFSFITYKWFGYILISALVLYVVGVWLKHLPQNYRLSKKGTPPRKIPYVIVLMVGHWLIFFAIIFFCEPVFRKLVGLRTTTKPGEVDGTSTFIVMFLAAALTAYVFYLGKKTLKAKEYNAKYIFNRELLGDICLCLGASVFTFAFWEKGILAIFNGRPLKEVMDLWFLFVLLGMSYVLFYLPLRYLFLIEDHSHNQTWKRLMLIMAFVLVRSLLVMI